MNQIADNNRDRRYCRLSNRWTVAKLTDKDRQSDEAEKEYPGHADVVSDKLGFPVTFALKDKVPVQYERLSHGSGM